MEREWETEREKDMTRAVATVGAEGVVTVRAKPALSGAVQTYKAHGGGRRCVHAATAGQ